MKQEGLSIIIPTVNEQEYIGNLLRCLANQTDKNFEVIVVDGHSNDSTCTVVSQFKKKIELKLINSKLRRVAYQRNLGVNCAKFERLLFLDADTLLDPNFIRNSLKAMRRKKFTVAVPKYTPDDDRWYYRIFFWHINTLLVLTQKIKPFGIGSAIFSAKDLHKEQRGFDEKLSWLDDIEYVNRVGGRGRFGVVPTKAIASVRRFEREGTKKTMIKWMIAYLTMLANRPSATNRIRYFRLPNEQIVACTPHEKV